MVRTLLVVTVLTLSALVAWGCGGSSSVRSSNSLTHAELITKADTICGLVNARLGLTTVSSRREIAQVFPKLAALERTELAELSKLQAPPELASDWRQILAGVQTLSEDSTRYGQAAKKKNLTGVEATLAAGEKVRQQAATVAKHDGFNDCAHVG
jgi:hypothetical protein